MSEATSINFCSGCSVSKIPPQSINMSKAFPACPVGTASRKQSPSPTRYMRTVTPEAGGFNMLIPVPPLRLLKAMLQQRNRTYPSGQAHERKLLYRTVQKFERLRKATFGILGIELPEVTLI